MKYTDNRSKQQHRDDDCDILPHRRASRKPSKPKADHRHKYVTYIEAESNAPAAKLTEFKVCTLCGKTSADVCLFHKNPNTGQTVLVFNYAQAQSLGIPVVIKGEHILGKPKTEV